MEIGRREVGEMMHCFGDKTFRKCVFSLSFCARLAKGAKSLHGSVYTRLRLLVKFRPNRFRFAGVISEKVTSYDRNTNICYTRVFGIKLVK